MAASRPRLDLSGELSPVSLQFIIPFILDRQFYKTCQLVSKQWFFSFVDKYLCTSVGILRHLSEMYIFSKNVLLGSIRQSMRSPTNADMRHAYVQAARQYFRYINNPMMSMYLNQSSFVDIIRILRTYLRVIYHTDQMGCSHIVLAEQTNDVIQQRLQITIIIDVLIMAYKCFAHMCVSIQIANFYLGISLDDLNQTDNSVVRPSIVHANIHAPYAMRVFEPIDFNRSPIYRSVPIWKSTIRMLDQMNDSNKTLTMYNVLGAHRAGVYHTLTTIMNIVLE